jgi:hypothetical protein
VKIAAVLRRKAYTGIRSSPGVTGGCVTRSWTTLRPGASNDWVSNWSKVSSATGVVCRAGPEGQHVDATVGDYSLSGRHHTDPEVERTGGLALDGAWLHGPEAEVLGVVDGLVYELGHVVVVQRVDDVAAVALSVDEAEVAKEAELVGDGRLFHADGFRQLADGGGTA